MIRILTMKDGTVVLDKRAASTASIEDIDEIARCEVGGGYADYAMVTVDGAVYSEYTLDSISYDAE